jgi:3-hydroxyisobutyrate dehydrogenase
VIVMPTVDPVAVTRLAELLPTGVQSLDAPALGSIALPWQAAFHVLATTPLAEQAQRRRDCLDVSQFPTRFRLALARKDADLMLAAADSAGRDLRLLPAVRRWLADAEQHGRSGQDYTAVLAAILDIAAGHRAG